MNSLKDIIKLDNERTKAKVECKHCHHKMTMIYSKMICSWCGYYVFKTPKEEFIYMMTKGKRV